MMRVNPVILFFALPFFGCATGGPGEEEVVPVPVYAKHDAPCEYEVIRRVEARGYVGDPRDFVEVRDRELGRVGARVGADAVILATGTGPVKLPFIVGDPEMARNRPISSTTFYGEAVRFDTTNCRG